MGEQGKPVGVCKLALLNTFLVLTCLALGFCLGIERLLGEGCEPAAAWALGETHCAAASVLCGPHRLPYLLSMHASICNCEPDEASGPS